MKISTRSISTSLRHATSNQNKENQCSSCAKCRVKDVAERIETTADNQRTFAARFSHSPSETHLDGTDWARIPVQSRWASRFERSPRIPGGSPMVGRWSSRTPGNEPSAVCLSLAQMGCDPHVRMPPGSKRLLAPVERGRDGRNVEEQKRLSMALDDLLDQIDVRGEVGEEERINEGIGGDAEDPEGVEGKRGGNTHGMDKGKRGEHQGKGRDKAKEVLQQEKSPGWRKNTGVLVKGPWTKQEDEKIIHCIMQNITKWSEVAQRVEGRVGKQCRERWLNHLDPSLIRSSWTATEDGILVQGQAQFGNSWTTISKLLPGRSENAVKNRWHSTIRKKRRKYGWSSSTETSRVPMPPKQQARQMHNSPMFHCSHQMQTHGAVHAGLSVPSPDMQECTRPVSQVSVHRSIPQASLNREHPPDQPSPKAVESKTVPELGYRHMLTDQQPLSSSVGMPMTPRSFQMGNHSQSEETLSLPLNIPATGVLGISSIGDAHLAAEDTAPKREHDSASTLTEPPNDQLICSDSKMDSDFDLDDEIFLPNIFPDVSLSQASVEDSFYASGSLGGSRQSFGDMGEALLVRQPFLKVHGDQYFTIDGVMTSSEYPSELDAMLCGDMKLERGLTGVNLFNEQESQLLINDVSPHPRLDCKNLLPVPTEPRDAGELPS